jgi:hypothetical protein
VRERLEQARRELDAIIESLRNGSSEPPAGEERGEARPSPPVAEPALCQADGHTAPPAPAQAGAQGGVPVPTATTPEQPSSTPLDPESHSAAGADSEPVDEDADGARLVALNMALNRTPRDEIAKYLAEHFTLADREGLLDDIYASIGG